MNDSTTTICSQDVGPEPEYLNAAQLARKIGVSVKAVQKWTAQRRIPSVKCGYHWRYPSVEINKRLLSGCLLSMQTKGKM